MNKNLTTKLLSLLIVLFWGMSCNANITKAHHIIVLDTIDKSYSQESPFPDTVYPSALTLHTEVEIIDSALPSSITSFKNLYEQTNGIYTFRGDPSRNPNFSGHLHGDSVQFKIDWTFSTANDTVHTKYGVWHGGTGWTGQPLFVEWPDSIMQHFRNNNDFLTPDFSNQELIVASLCNNLYFIDFNTGKPTRDSYNTGNVLKGTPSLHPSLNGHLYVGEGVPKKQQFGFFVFDMFSHKVINSAPLDRKAWRGWFANDGSSLAVDKFVFRTSENGTLYKYYTEGNSFALQSKLRYSTTQNNRTPGIESSIAVCRNYGYIADNNGNLLCINLNSMRPVWLYSNHDDTDATPLLEICDGHPFLYSGCEVDHQGDKGYSYFIKLDGLTGELIWEDTIPGHNIKLQGKELDGGMFSSPLLGAKDCADLIFCNFCVNTGSTHGLFIAFDKKDGRIIYQTKTKHYCWSSPVAFFKDETMYIFTADTGGYVYLIEGKTGEIVASKKIGINFESSPIVVNDKVIIGSRGNKIYRISLE